MEVKDRQKDKYKQERIFRAEYKEEDNVIEISDSLKGYRVDYVNNNFINMAQNNRQETYIRNSVVNGDYCDVITALTNLTASFYDKGIILVFDEFLKEIPRKEKETIEKIVKKLEAISISHKTLLNSINKIKELTSDDLLYESKKIPDFG